MARPQHWWLALSLCLLLPFLLIQPAYAFIPHSKWPLHSRQYTPPLSHHEDSLFPPSPDDPVVSRQHHLRHDTRHEAATMPFIAPIAEFPPVMHFTPSVVMNWLWGVSRQTYKAPSVTKTKPRAGRAIQVVTDIDDTIKSSGGWRFAGIPLGGIDTQYPRGDFYPGAFQFALELGRHQLPKGVQPQRVAVLTARAREFKFALELKPSHKVSRAFAAAGVNNGVEGWGIGTVLYGSVLEWICQHRKGWRKFINFESLKGMDRNNLLDYVLVGDTGELDQQAAEMIIDKYPDAVRAVFLHYVTDISPVPPMPQDVTRQGVPIIFFRTYVGAAVRAVELGLMDPEALEQVVTKAVLEFETRSGKSTPDQWEDLRKDIEAAEVSILGPYREKKRKATTGVSPLSEFWAQLLAKIFGLDAPQLQPQTRPRVRVRKAG